METLSDKIADIQTAPSQEEAFRRFNKAMADYGYDSNVYTLLTDHPSIGQRSQHGLAASYPQDWIDYYNARSYQRIDPVWQRLLRSPTPFFWGDEIERLRWRRDMTDDEVAASVRMMEEAAEAGVADGIGVSFVNPLGEMAAVGLSRTKAVNERRFEVLAEVFLLATFFHEKFLSFYNQREAPTLTKREREVLLWATENKSDPEISQILTISHSAVRFHWSNIFKKLGTNGRLPSVVKAMQLQLITPHLVATSWHP